MNYGSGQLTKLCAKEISLGDMQILNGFLNQYPTFASEYSFANLFVWRAYRAIHWYIHNNHLFLCYPSDGDLVFMQPIGPDPISAIAETLSDFPENQWVRIETSVADGVELPITSQSVADENNEDYLYSRSEQLLLEGSKFKIVRKQLNRFEANYAGRYRVELLTNDTIVDCKSVVERWIDQKNGQDFDSCHKDANACIEFLSHFDLFQAHGVIIYVDEKPASFTVGLKGAQNHFVSHFAKSDLNISDISTISHYSFIKSLGDEVKYVNLMQDCGDPGLRNWKQSFRPIDKVRKSTITCKF